MRNSCIIFVCMLIAGAVSITGSASAGEASLQILSGDRQMKELACLPIRPGEEFDLQFINSIYRAPVKETMTYTREEGIVLIRVESPCAGVFEYYGLPTDGSGQATLRRTVGEFRVRSHDYEHHRLSAGKHSMRLKGLVADGEPVIVRVIPDRPCTNQCRGRG